jgi:hypothetical protein
MRFSNNWLLIPTAPTQSDKNMKKISSTLLINSLATIKGKTFWTVERRKNKGQAILSKMLMYQKWKGADPNLAILANPKKKALKKGLAGMLRKAHIKKLDLTAWTIKYLRALLKEQLSLNVKATTKTIIFISRKSQTEKRLLIDNPRPTDKQRAGAKYSKEIFTFIFRT